MSSAILDSIFATLGAVVLFAAAMKAVNSLLPRWGGKKVISERLSKVVAAFENGA